MEQRQEDNRVTRRKRTQHGWRYGGGYDVAPPSSMNIISWNCRGLGDSRAVRTLTRMVRDEAPLLVFLVETKANTSFMKRV